MTPARPFKPKVGPIITRSITRPFGPSKSPVFITTQPIGIGCHFPCINLISLVFYKSVNQSLNYLIHPQTKSTINAFPNPQTIVRPHNLADLSLWRCCNLFLSLTSVQQTTILYNYTPRDPLHIHSHVPLIHRFHISFFFFFNNGQASYLSCFSLSISHPIQFRYISLINLSIYIITNNIYIYISFKSQKCICDKILCD